MIRSYYPELYRLADGDPFILNVVCGSIVGIGAYAIFNLFFIYLDLTQPKWAMKYKIQDEKMPSMEKYKAALPRIAANSIFFGPLTAVLFYPLTKYRTLSYSLTLPSWWTVLWQLMVCVVVEEIAFYYSHRLLHHPRIYKYIHKVHHEWTAPVSITSVYCHWFEHMVSNCLPLLLGPWACGAHITTQWIWITLALGSTTSSHSGYHFPLQPSSQPHDYHHKVFNECFGVTGWLDTFHKTNTTFLASVNGQRDRSFPLGNVKEMYPDTKKSG